MIIECPYCARRYQLNPALLKGPNPMLKCSRCLRIFPAPPARKPSPPPRPARVKPAAAAGENLTLPLDEPSWKDEPKPPPQEDFSSPDSEEFTLGADATDGEGAVPQRLPVTDLALHARAAPPPPEEEAGAAPADRRAERGAIRERSDVKPVFIFLLLVVAAYAVFTRALFASPAWCDRLVGRLPLIGTLGDERLLVRKVALSDVVGSYQRIKEGKEVFVITGKALNTASVALHGVQITGKLYDGTRRPLDQKTIYCGNVISAKVLKDLTPRELSILQRLSPPRRFVVEPGAPSTFVIVFMDPPREAVEFSTQVVAAQRQA